MGSFSWIFLLIAAVFAWSGEWGFALGFLLGFVYSVWVGDNNG